MLKFSALHSVFNNMQTEVLAVLEQNMNIATIIEGANEILKTGADAVMGKHARETRSYRLRKALPAEQGFRELRPVALEHLVEWK